MLNARGGNYPFLAIIDQLSTILSVLPGPERCVGHSHVTEPSVAHAFWDQNIFLP